MTLEIQHQEEESLFFINVDGGQRAFVKYRRLGNRAAQSAVDFWSTFVPESQRGTGMAKALIDFAFAWAESERLHIETSCWYAARVKQARELKETTDQ